MVVGRVAEIWRHPVKSMQGERLARTTVGPRGLPGDRAWAVRDEVREGIRGAKKIAGLMRCAARYASEPVEGRVPAPEITLPDGSRFAADAADAAARVSAAVGAEVTLWPQLPATNLDHYRRGRPDHAAFLAELRAIFGREEGEPLPDLGAFPPDLLQYESPPGTYFDAFPLLLLTDATLRRLASLAPGSRPDVRRFRPNFLIEATEAAAAAAFPEIAWAGKRLRIGGARVEATITCPRCVMVTLPFADLPKDTALLRTIVREAGQNVGVYASPTSAGEVRVGDEVEVE
jgi:hypothetical protein